MANDRYVSLDRLVSELHTAFGATEGVTPEIVRGFVMAALERGWLMGLTVETDGATRYALEALELLLPAAQLWLMGADYGLIQRIAADPDPIIAMMLDLHLTCRGIEYDDADAQPDAGAEGKGDGTA